MTELLRLSTRHAVAEGLRTSADLPDPVTAEALAGHAPALEEAEDALVALEEAGTVGFRSLDLAAWEISRARGIAQGLRAATDTLLVLGIGGSALGASALDHALGSEVDPSHRVVVLDTVDPYAIARTLSALDPLRTAVAVISKSGGTVETAALYRVVLPWMQAASDTWKERLVFVTDREAGALRPLAGRHGIAALPVPDDVGGRFSVLTAVGMLPAAYRGLDVAGMLAGAADMAAACRTRSLGTNPAWAFAAAHDLRWPRLDVSVLLTYSERLARMGDWFMQLWGESLGKPLSYGGRYGWTPAAARGPADQHSQLQLWQQGPANRMVTVVSVDDPGASVPIPSIEGAFGHVGEYLAGGDLGALLDAERRGTTAALVSAGRPVLELALPRVDAHAIGQLVMFLETATALTGLLRGIDPFDQPGVEAGKRYAFGLLGREGYEDAAGEVERILGSDGG